MPLILDISAAKPFSCKANQSLNTFLTGKQSDELSLILKKTEDINESSKTDGEGSKTEQWNIIIALSLS